MSLEALLGQVSRWAAQRSDVLGVALVGSYARGNPHQGSDVDLVMVVENVDRYLSDDGWLRSFGRVESIDEEDYGLVQSRRVRYAGGLEVEWGLTDRKWLCTKPLDEPTAKVIAEGMRILRDPHGSVGKLHEAVRMWRERPP